MRLCNLLCLVVLIVGSVRDKIVFGCTHALEFWVSDIWAMHHACMKPSRLAREGEIEKTEVYGMERGRGMEWSRQKRTKLWTTRAGQPITPTVSCIIIISSLSSLYFLYMAHQHFVYLTPNYYLVRLIRIKIGVSFFSCKKTDPHPTHDPPDAMSLWPRANPPPPWHQVTKTKVVYRNRRRIGISAPY